MGSHKFFVVLLLVSQTLSDGTEVSRAFVENGLVPDVVSVPPLLLVQITYSNGAEVRLGNVLSVATVATAPVKVDWDANPKCYYTLAMVDPDALSRSDPVLSEIKHWLVVNILGQNIRNGTTLASYLPPTPPPGSGLHRYTFIVYLQPGWVAFNESPIIQEADRFHFSIRKFANKYNLKIYAGNFFQAQITPVTVF